MRKMWTYRDDALSVKAYWPPGEAAGAGSWVLVDQATGTVQGVVPAGEFSRRFRPVDVFADVPGLPGYLGTVTATDGTALVDLVLDRNPFAEGYRAFSAALGGDAVQVERDSTRLAAGLRAAAQPWGGNYCSYQLGVDGPGWVMPALGPAQDEVNRRLARADGLSAEPDPRLGGAINLVRPSLGDEGRLAAAQRATTDQRASFETFAAHRGLTR